MTVDFTPEVSARQALRLVSDGAEVLDVRDGWEWIEGHAPRAHHVPLPQLPIAGIPRWNSKRVVVLCRSGSRARTATNLLRSRGVEAFVVAGGMGAWRDAGGRVVSTDGSPGLVA
ncbi:MAG: rhodanese-like domain-containing protein [Propionibacteriaceae bacterium]|nr:rhodanese-like domain-containing protein [Propionibacteriaceae bacterium]